MNDRERVEQAAINLGWQPDQESTLTVSYWLRGSGWLRVRYTSAGNIQWVDGTPYRTRQPDTAEQIIVHMEHIATERAHR